MVEGISGTVAGKKTDTPWALVLPQTIRKLLDGRVVWWSGGLHVRLAGLKH